MGVHEFLKNAGAKVIKAQENQAEEARNYVNKMLGGKDDEIKGLRIEIKNGEVKMYGKCKSQRAREKAVLIAGNINGVGKVFSDGLEIVGKALKGGKGSEGRFYTIKAGDTLSKIAKQFYGDANKYMDIVRENQGVIKDADNIYPGQVIRIPESE